MTANVRTVRNMNPPGGWYRAGRRAKPPARKLKAPGVRANPRGPPAVETTSGSQGVTVTVRTPSTDVVRNPGIAAVTTLVPEASGSNAAPPVPTVVGE
jgi:hypothetical protein